MDTNLDRAEQYLTKAWSHAQRIDGSTDENLKSCLIFLSSGLLSLASSQRADRRREEQARHHPANRGAIQTARGIRMDFEDLP